MRMKMLGEFLGSSSLAFMEISPLDLDISVTLSRFKGPKMAHSNREEEATKSQ